MSVKINNNAEIIKYLPHLGMLNYISACAYYRDRRRRGMFLVFKDRHARCIRYINWNLINHLAHLLHLGKSANRGMWTPGLRAIYAIRGGVAYKNGSWTW